MRRNEQEMAAVREENLRMRSQSENVEGLLKVLGETEDVLKRKVSSFISIILTFPVSKLRCLRN
jgi:hypothetical protein